MSRYARETDGHGEQQLCGSPAAALLSLPSVRVQALSDGGAPSEPRCAPGVVTILAGAGHHKDQPADCSRRHLRVDPADNAGLVSLAEAEAHHNLAHGADNALRQPECRPRGVPGRPRRVSSAVTMIASPGIELASDGGGEHGCTLQPLSITINGDNSGGQRQISSSQPTAAGGHESHSYNQASLCDTFRGGHRISAGALPTLRARQSVEAWPATTPGAQRLLPALALSTHMPRHAVPISAVVPIEAQEAHRLPLSLPPLRSYPSPAWSVTQTVGSQREETASRSAKHLPPAAVGSTTLQAWHAPAIDDTPLVTTTPHLPPQPKAPERALRGSVRTLAQRIVTHRWFDYGALLLIAANCVTLAMYLPTDRSCATVRCQMLEVGQRHVPQPLYISCPTDVDCGLSL